MDWSGPGSENDKADDRPLPSQKEGRGSCLSIMAEKESKIYWYPVRVFFGRAELIKTALSDADTEYFYPTRLVEKPTPAGLQFVPEPLVRSLIFVRTTRENLHLLRTKFGGTISPYYDKAEHMPLVVPDKQMDQFIKLCEMRDSGLEYLGGDDPKYHEGDRVRVTEGIFKGFEGHVKRIRHDRKLIVTIEGVAAFATRFIPPSCLEKIEEKII